jgi:glucokinase
MTSAPEPSPTASRTCAIGLDVGGTKIAGGIVTPDGRIFGRRVIPTLPGRGGEAVLRDAMQLSADLLTEAREAGLSPVSIGVGVGELVDLQGNITSDQTIHWRRLPVREQFSTLAPALMEADSRAAGFCEAQFGVGRPFKSLLYITVGTGIGCSLVVDGVPYAGARGSTGTLASSPMTVVCPHCGKTSRPILEEMASGPALVARYNQRSSKPATSCQEILAAVAAGNPDAVEVVRTGGEALGVTAALLVNVLDPEAVVVGGGLGSAAGLYWDSFVTAARMHIWSGTHRQLPILKASYGGDAGFVGAAMLAFRRYA